MVVLVLPRPQLLGEIQGAPEYDPAVELLLIGPVAALHFPVTLWGGQRDGPVADPEVLEVPGEAGPELGAVVGPDRWMAPGKRCRSSSMKSIADRMELWA